jgi:hypothetical protein
MKYLFESTVIWSSDEELKSKAVFSQFASIFSGVPPVHDHEGQLLLTENDLMLNGDANLIIPLSAIEQLFLGFDEVYKRNYVRNLGMFCQPLRITYRTSAVVNILYLISGYNLSSCEQTKQLFSLLQQILS